MVVQKNPGFAPGADWTSNAVIVDFPLTLNLHVQRSTLSSSNTGHFTIYNLQDATRRQILKDWFDNDVNHMRKMILYAGYLSETQQGKTIPAIFHGDIQWAYSYRQKQDWITEIEAFDGGDALQNGQVDVSAPSGYDLKSVIASVIGTLPGVSQGVIGNVAAAQSSRGLCLSGNSWEVLKKLAPDAEVYVDDEKVNVMAKNDYIQTGAAVPLISSDTGLLETPRKFNDRIEVKILFEPTMRVGMLVKIQSIETFYNGLFCVKGVTHSGTISGAIGGQMITTLSVWRGTEGLKGVNG